MTQRYLFKYGPWDLEIDYIRYNGEVRFEKIVATDTGQIIPLDSPLGDKIRKNARTEILSQPAKLF